MKTPLSLLLFLFSIIIALSCNETQEDIKELPLLTFNNVSIIEEGDIDKSIPVTFNLSTSLNETVSFRLSTEAYTATSSEDFEPIDEIITFSPGELTKTQFLVIKGDEQGEPTEEFFLNMSEPNGISIPLSTISVAIRDNDEYIDNNILTIPSTGYTSPTSYPGMQLVWQDEFNDNSLNPSYWTHEIGTGNSGWGNNELQYYKAQNTYFSEGKLIIEARKEPFGNRLYTSSRIITKDKYEVKYGRVDIRAALPEGQGIWPALWMLGENIESVSWPACGEIDITELVGGGNKDSEVHGTIHWQNASLNHVYSGEKYVLPTGKFSDEFHVFSIVWTANAIIWYVDGNLFNTISTTPAEMSEFQNEFFFIFNVAVGGRWPGSPNSLTVFPQRMIVDYIRVFQ